MEDLKERLAQGIKPRLLNGTCEFDVCNDTPPEWNVTIVEGGARFFNSDGTDYTDGPRAINVPTGTCAPFNSVDNTKCVKQVFLAVNVSVPGEEPQTFTYQTEMSPEGQCWTRQGVVLGQNNLVREGGVGPRTLASQLVLRAKA